MTITSHTQRCRGFARSDAIAMLALIAIAAALMLAGSRQVRQEAIAASSLSQLRWISGATSSYAADNADRYWNFSWTPETVPAGYPAASSDYVAHGYQAVDILRRRGRPDMPVVSAWIPYPRYSHLPLVDYLDCDIPDFNFVSPADKNRLAWARDPAAFDAGAFLPLQPTPSETNKRWAYSSSYEQPTSLYDQSPAGQRISQGGTHSTYAVPGGTILGAWRISDVAHPSQKTHISDTADWSRGLFFLDKRADVPMLMADGSADVRRTADSNWGWVPNQPTSAGAHRFTYSPQPWEPQGTFGIVEGHYRWTRGGIAGRDFGGPEVDTGQP